MITPATARPAPTKKPTAVRANRNSKNVARNASSAAVTLPLDTDNAVSAQDSSSNATYVLRRRDESDTQPPNDERHHLHKFDERAECISGHPTKATNTHTAKAPGNKRAAQHRN